MPRDSDSLAYSASYYSDFQYANMDRKIREAVFRKVATKETVHLYVNLPLIIFIWKLSC